MNTKKVKIFNAYNCDRLDDPFKYHNCIVKKNGKIKDNITPLDCGEKIHSLIKKSYFFSLAGDHYFFLRQAQKIEELYLKAKSI